MPADVEPIAGVIIPPTGVAAIAALRAHAPSTLIDAEGLAVALAAAGAVAVLPESLLSPPQAVPANSTPVPANNTTDARPHLLIT